MKHGWMVFVAILFLGISSAFSSILVDQFGYESSSAKLAVVKQAVAGRDSLSDTLTPLPTFRVVDTLTGSSVYEGSSVAWNGGTVHGQSGDRAWTFDFSSVTASGMYRIEENGGSQKSHPFEIRINPYKSVLHAAQKVFFYQRIAFEKTAQYAGTNWADGAAYLQDSICRDVFDQSNAAKIRDMRGGWFDAGDFNKYVTFANLPVHLLLTSYTVGEPRGIWDDEAGIPESGNGKPDLLDELKWELDWLLRMQDTADGGVFIKMGDNSYSSQSPPSVNHGNRYYGKKATSATVAFAGMCAHAAVVYKTVPGWEAFADTLEAAAVKAWGYYAGHPIKDTAVDNGEVKSGDADWKNPDQSIEEAVVGSWMSILTEAPLWDSLISASYTRVSQLGWWGPYGQQAGEALLAYAAWSKADPSIASAIISAKQNAVNGAGIFYGDPTTDPWRAAMPDGQYHWGSAQILAITGILNLDFVRSGCAGADSLKYLDRARDIAHYLNGRNPLGKCYLTNMYAWGAENPVNEMYHGWFNNGTPWDNALTSAKGGPAPGYVVGGPNGSYTGCAALPAGQPIQKMYADFNDGSPINSWEVTEPAIYYQAAYIRLLSAFVNTSADTIGASGSNAIHVPTTHIQHSLLKPGMVVSAYDLRGKSFSVKVGSDGRIDTKCLSSGFYVVPRMGNMKLMVRE